MQKYFSRLLKLSTFDLLLLVIYLGLFVYFILQPAIYSPDTGTYWHLNVYRYPVYGLFLRTMEFVFKDFYNFSVVGFQLLFGFIASFIFLKKITQLLSLPRIAQFILFVLLVLPFFPPLEIGNNLTSEGLAYPLYLLLIVYGIDILFLNKKKQLLVLIPVFLALSLTRGQFIFFAPFLLFLYILKHRKMVFQRNHFIVFITLLLLPLAANIMDSNYRKLVHGKYAATPFTFINALTLPLYISDKEDISLFSDEDQKVIFTETYKRIDSLGLLSHKVGGSVNDRYKVFHDNFPVICNQTFHAKSIAHYYNLNSDPVEACILAETGAKKMFIPLMTHHFKEWISIYFTSVIHGFKSIFIFLFFFLVMLYSGWKTLKSFNLYYGLLFLGSILIVSNAFITAFAVHTIIRYTFYNIGMGFIIVFLLSKKITSKL